MPIKDLSDIRRLSRGGKLRIGEMVADKNGKGEHPEPIDYFKADLDDNEVAKIFYDLYGDRPKSVTVSFVKTTDAFSHWYKLYGRGAGLRCKGDGEWADRYETGQENVPCDGPEDCEFSLANGSHGKPGCSRKATLSYFIKGLPKLQIFQTDTGSRNSIININSGLDLLALVAERRGQPVFGMWVELVLRPMEVTQDGTKRNIKVLDIIIPGSLESVTALEAPPERAALPAPADDIPDPITDEPPPQHPEATVIEPANEHRGLADDPAVLAAFAEVGFPDWKRIALIKSAQLNKWSPEQFVDQIQLLSRADASTGDAPDTVEF